MLQERVLGITGPVYVLLPVKLALALPWHHGQEPDLSMYPSFPAGIENLPFELQRNFQLMRDLDQRTEGED